MSECDRYLLMRLLFVGRRLQRGEITADEAQHLLCVSENLDEHLDDPDFADHVRAMAQITRRIPDAAWAEKLAGMANFAADMHRDRGDITRAYAIRCGAVTSVDALWDAFNVPEPPAHASGAVQLRAAARRQRQRLFAAFLLLAFTAAPVYLLIVVAPRPGTVWSGIPPPARVVRVMLVRAVATAAPPRCGEGPGHGVNSSSMQRAEPPQPHP